MIILDISITKYQSIKNQNIIVNYIYNICFVASYETTKQNKREILMDINVNYLTQILITILFIPTI